MSDQEAADCIFCKIVAGQVPSREAHSSPLTYAFYDLRPVAPVHALVVPRVHIADITRVGPEHGPLMAEMVTTARAVAENEGLLHNGYRLVFNVGTDAGAEVAHMHMHVLGGRRLSWPPG